MYQSFFRYLSSDIVHCVFARFQKWQEYKNTLKILNLMYIKEALTQTLFFGNRQIMTNLSQLKTSFVRVHKGYLFRDFFRARNRNFGFKQHRARQQQFRGQGKHSWPRHSTASTRKATGMEEEMKCKARAKRVPATSQHKLVTYVCLHCLCIDVGVARGSASRSVSWCAL